MVLKLGILVNSDRHPEYVREMTRAACRCNKQVHVHFTGEGLRLADHPALVGLQHRARVTREAVGSGDEQTVNGWPVIGLADFFLGCDRHVVF